MVWCDCLKVLVACLIITLSISVASGQADYAYEDIQFPGASATVVASINDHGTVVGTHGNLQFGDFTVPSNRGFVFDGETYETIHVPGSVATTASGISNFDQIVGTYRTSSNDLRGYVFDGQSYVDVVAPWGTHTLAVDIDDKGVIVGNYTSDPLAAELHAFTFDGQTYRKVDFHELGTTVLNGINNGGQQVGNYHHVASPLEVISEAFVLPTEDVVSHPDGILTGLNGIGTGGHAVGVYTVVEGFFDVHYEGFVYNTDQETFNNVSLPGPSCTFSLLAGVPTQCVRSLEDVNSSGTIVGYYDNNDGILRGFIGRPSSPWLQAGDSDQDLDFDQVDVVHVLEAAKYLTGEPASWAEGDWDGAPGGSVDDPPLGDGVFDQEDIVAALRAGTYLTGPYAGRSIAAEASIHPVAPIPEPGTLPMFCLAILGTLSFSRLVGRR